MARTLLQIVQDACSDVGQPRPNVVASATLETPVRMLRILNKAGIALAREIEWNALTTVRTFTATASQVQSAEPPSDYSRITPISQLWDVSLKRPAVGPLPMDKWLNLITNTVTGGDKYWAIIGDKINLYPTPAGTEQFTYAYQSKNWVYSSTSVGKDRFTLDDDTPRIDDELLTLELIWRWKQAIGIDYAESMQDATRQKEIVFAANRGPRVLNLSSPWQGELPSGYWPGVISP